MRRGGVINYVLKTCNISPISCSYVSSICIYVSCLDFAEFWGDKLELNYSFKGKMSVSNLAYNVSWRIAKFLLETS